VQDQCEGGVASLCKAHIKMSKGRTFLRFLYKPSLSVVRSPGRMDVTQLEHPKDVLNDESRQFALLVDSVTDYAI